MQMSSMFHWKDGRIDSAEVYRAYRSLSTTSPSFHMLAALDGTRAFMEARGAEIIDAAIAVAEYFVEQLKTISELEVSVSADPTKLLLHFPEHDVPVIAKYLEDQGIISEKYEAHNITLVVGFQSTKADVDKTVDVIKRAIKQMKPAKVDFPKFPTTIQRKPLVPIENAQAVLLDETVGKVCGEYVIPYPPGIPVLAPGEVIRQEHIDYIKAVQAKGELMTIFMSEPTTIRVA